MREFDHVVLTRYSAVYSLDAPPVGEDWLRYRLGFFEEACLPSMRSQTNRDFRWLIFLDDRCSSSFGEDFEALAGKVFECVWTHEFFPGGVYRGAVMDIATAQYLITTRLDSDDAVARDFVDAVQGQFVHQQERTFVNFSQGLQMERSGAIYRYAHTSSPFVSLIERRVAGAPPFTVFGPGEHVLVHLHGALRNVQTAPMWIQLIHGGNVSNSLLGSRIGPAVVADRFDIDLWYRDQVPLPRLILEKAVQQVRVWRVRLRHPTLLRGYLWAVSARLRGTHERPMLDGAARDRFLARRATTHRRARERAASET